MKRLLILLLPVALMACNHPEQKDTTSTPQDSVAPGVVQPDSDSGRYNMPVQKTDTAATNQQMPVAMPGDSVQPK